MRIEFPRSAREDFHWTQPQLRIGSAPDNDLVLAAGHAAEHHVRIQHDRRGWVLQVLSTAARIHVNARPVRERALLRAGDVVSVGGCRMLLRDDEDPAQRPALQVSQEGRCTVALRAVGGPLSGRVLSLGGSLELGSQSRVPLDLPQGEQVDYGPRPYTHDDFVTWAQLKEMQDSGLVEVASHTDDAHHGVRGDHRDELLRVADRRDHLEAEPGQDPGQALTQQHPVLGQDDPGHCRHGSSTRTSVGPPSGLASSSRPPRRLTRGG